MIFKCEICGKSELEEVVVNVTTYHKIIEIDVEGEHLVYGDFDPSRDSEGGTVLHYNCGFCGDVLLKENGETAQSIEDLIECIKEDK